MRMGGGFVMGITTRGIVLGMLDSKRSVQGQLAGYLSSYGIGTPVHQRIA